VPIGSPYSCLTNLTASCVPYAQNVFYARRGALLRLRHTRDQSNTFKGEPHRGFLAQAAIWRRSLYSILRFSASTFVCCNCTKPRNPETYHEDNRREIECTHSPAGCIARHTMSALHIPPASTQPYSANSSLPRVLWHDVEQKPGNQPRIATCSQSSQSSFSLLGRAKSFFSMLGTSLSCEFCKKTR